MSDEESRPSIGRVRLQAKRPSLPEPARMEAEAETTDLPPPPPLNLLLPPVPAQDENAEVEPGTIILQVESARIKFSLLDIVAKVGDVAATLWWSDLLSRAERELLVLEATFRHQRGRALASIAADSKVPEWKALASIEGGAAWLGAKNAIAEATRNVTLLREVVAALRSARTS